MLKDLFLAPGRLLGKIFSREKRRTYRSTRGRPGVSPGVVILSLLSWLALAGVALYAADKAGLLKQALDVGVEVAGQNAEGDTPDPAPAPPALPDSTSASGAITPGGQTSGGGVLPPAGSTAQTGAAIQPPETELWLVILHTIPKEARQEAERRQTQYRSKGLGVEILDTDAFPRLSTGYWIIAQGPFEDRASALAAADKAKAFNSGLMVRRGL